MTPAIIGHIPKPESHSYSVLPPSLHHQKRGELAGNRSGTRARGGAAVPRAEPQSSVLGGGVCLWLSQPVAVWEVGLSLYGGSACHRMGGRFSLSELPPQPQRNTRASLLLEGGSAPELLGVGGGQATGHQGKSPPVSHVDPPAAQRGRLHSG